MIKKVSSIFLLFAFLFPLVEKELHAYEHKNDFHCLTLADKHFHEESHDCNICDFNIPATEAIDIAVAGNFFNELTIHLIPGSVNLKLDNRTCFFPPRAPPVRS